MKQVYWTLVTLLSHWRRRPANFAALFVGLAITTALWSGVQALNEHARKSYDRAASAFGAPSGFSPAPIVISKPPVAFQLPQPDVSANRDAPQSLAGMRRNSHP